MKYNHGVRFGSAAHIMYISHSSVNRTTPLKCGYNHIRWMGNRGGSRGEGGGIRKLHNVSNKSIKK